MAPLYIFDLDGTLALNQHREHLIAKKRKGGPDWDAFFLASADDEPNHQVIETALNLQRAGCEIRIWSGRSDIAKSVTIAWLERAGLDPKTIPMQMRTQRDYTPDDVLKRRWLDELSPQDRARLVAVFDDRQKVVDMWRASGVSCFQVAPGDF